MILVSAALVLAAIVLLIAGVVLGQAFLVMWSIVISVLSAVCLLIGALVRRNELFPAGGRAHADQMAAAQMVPAGVPVYSGAPAHPAATQVMTAPQAAAATTVAAQPPVPAPPVPRPSASPSTGPLGAGAIVLVIPGRKRFHLPSCRQLAGRDVEELTVEEAREEGFSPCTTCVAPEGKPEPRDEPVDPAEMAPGRAGREVSASSTHSWDAFARPGSAGDGATVEAERPDKR